MRDLKQIRLHLTLVILTYLLKRYCVVFLQLDFYQIYAILYLWLLLNLTHQLIHSLESGCRQTAVECNARLVYNRSGITKIVLCEVHISQFVKHQVTL